MATDSNTQKSGNASIKAVQHCNSTLCGYNVFLTPLPTGALSEDNMPGATQDSSVGSQSLAVMAEGCWE